MHKTQQALVDLLVDGSLAGVEGGDQSSNAAHHRLVAGLDHEASAGALHHVGRVEGQVSRLQVVQAHKADKEPPGGSWTT